VKPVQTGVIAALWLQHGCTVSPGRFGDGFKRNTWSNRGDPVTPGRHRKVSPMDFATHRTESLVARSIALRVAWRSVAPLPQPSSATGRLTRSMRPVDRSWHRNRPLGQASSGRSMTRGSHAKRGRNPRRSDCCSSKKASRKFHEARQALGYNATAFGARDCPPACNVGGHISQSYRVSFQESGAVPSAGLPCLGTRDARPWELGSDRIF
jgi:hypothetical protein